MMGECEVCVVSKFEEKGLVVVSCSEYEKQSVSDEERVMKSEKEEEESVVVNGKSKWMEEYPPLTSRGGVQVLTVNLVPSTTTSWVDALKKPHCPSDDANRKIQVDKFMQVCSKNSKRFGTLNGRALGPVEKTRHVVPVFEKETREKSANNNDDGSASKAKDIIVPLFEEENQNREKSANNDDDDDGLAKQTEDIMRHEAEVDLKEDVSIDKAEETECKDMGVEAELKADKRDKKRLKRMRLRERKKAAAVARDGFSLNPTPLLLIQTHNEEAQQQSELLDLLDSNEEAQQQTESHELVDANEEAQQQTELLREKRRKKKMARKKRNKERAVGANARNKWIFIIFISLILVLFFTRLYIF